MSPMLSSAMYARLSSRLTMLRRHSRAGRFSDRLANSQSLYPTPPFPVTCRLRIGCSSLEVCGLLCPGAIRLDQERAFPLFRGVGAVVVQKKFRRQRQVGSAHDPEGKDVKARRSFPARDRPGRDRGDHPVSHVYAAKNSSPTAEFADYLRPMIL
jgi:hypothetical protein